MEGNSFEYGYGYRRVGSFFIKGFIALLYRNLIVTVEDCRFFTIYKLVRSHLMVSENVVVIRYMEGIEVLCRNAKSLGRA